MAGKGIRQFRDSVGNPKIQCKIPMSSFPKYVSTARSFENSDARGSSKSARYGDSAYRGRAQRERMKQNAPRARDFTNKRAYRNAPLTKADRQTNRRKSAVRSKIEHPFLTLKRLWGFARVRYRGLAKNANRAFAMLAMVSQHRQMGTTFDGTGAPRVSAK